MTIRKYSPNSLNKLDRLLNHAVPLRTESGLPLIYINQVGGQDELIFDGASFGLNADCTLGFQLAAFRELVTTVQLERSGNGWSCTGPLVLAADDPDQGDYTACMQGLR